MDDDSAVCITSVAYCLLDNSLSNPKSKIVLTNGLDSLCEECPHGIEFSCWDKEEIKCMLTNRDNGKIEVSEIETDKEYGAVII
jgi:hypothetical protein